MIHQWASRSVALRDFHGVPALRPPDAPRARSLPMRRAKLARLVLRLIVTSGESGVITRIPADASTRNAFGCDPA
jgi:hypothetical protein